MNSFNVAVHTTVSPVALSSAGEPHVVRKGAELSVAVSLNANLPMARSLDLIAELVTDGGALLASHTDEGMTPLSSVTRYVLRAGQTGATLRPRINLLSSAFDGADIPFRIRVRALDDDSVEPAFSPLIVVRSKWPTKSKREAMAAAVPHRPPESAPAPAPAPAPRTPAARALGPVGERVGGGLPWRNASDAASGRRSDSEQSDGAMDMRHMGASLAAADAASHSREGSGSGGSAADGPVGDTLGGDVTRLPTDSACLDANDGTAALLPAEFIDQTDLDEMLRLLVDDELVAQTIGTISGAGGAGDAHAGPPPKARAPTAAELAEIAMQQTDASAAIAEALADAFAANAPAEVDLCNQPPPMAPVPRAGAHSVHAVMPTARQRVRTVVHGYEGESAALDSLEVALEDGRRKRRPLSVAPALTAGIAPARSLLPAWLDRVSLCKASGFVCVEALADPSALARAGVGGVLPPSSLRVRWTSANMNSTVGLPLDRLLGTRPLLELFSVDSQSRLASVASELLASRARLALDCGVVLLTAAAADGRHMSATCHAMMHTDGSAEGSLAVPKVLVLLRVHSHALGDSPMLTFDHPRACDAPSEDGDVVRRLFAGRVHYASPSTIDLCGYEAWHFLGREAGCSVHPDDAHRWFQYKLDVSRRLQAEPNTWVSHLFTHRHVHRELGWVWVHCATQSRLARAPPHFAHRPPTVHDTLACALHEVIVRTRAVEESELPMAHAASTAMLEASDVLGESEEPPF
ncbi:hypothetical protein KFE25_011393 [Diacronema lutheri]|uniref:Uncharacterized protein n=2 Tax=Diacronema lutheri TaxID=2081491 RepID=A0A8J5XBN1_DIALT|nr:hypothetical protein KFE25_011393 [Diacronema lutheri]